MPWPTRSPPGSPVPRRARRLPRSPRRVLTDGDLRGRPAVVLGVGHVVTPGRLTLRDREVGHSLVGRGAVPVPLVGRCVDRVAATHRDDGRTARLDEALAFGDVEGLAVAV